MDWTELRTTLAGDNQDRAKALEGFADPNAFLEHAFRPEPDWRKGIAGEDAETLKELERIDSPSTLYKRFKDSQEFIRSSGKVKVPGEGATEQEVAEFRKAVGVPEKPDGYQITVKAPDGYEVTEGDKQFLGSMTERLHKAGATPEMVNVAHELYYEASHNALLEGEESYAQSAVKADKELRQFYGSRYDDSIAFANAAVSQFHNGDAAEVLDAKISVDGFTGNLGDWPPFVKMMSMIGHQNAGDPYFLKAAGKSGVDPQARLNELMALRVSDKSEDRKRYNDPAVQGEIRRLIAGGLRQQEIAAAR